MKHKAWKFIALQSCLFGVLRVLLFGWFWVVFFGLFGVFLSEKAFTKTLGLLHGNVKYCFDFAKFLLGLRKTLRQRHLQPCYKDSLAFGNWPFGCFFVCCSLKWEARIDKD